jgi:hypothetical protein
VDFVVNRPLVGLGNLSVTPTEPVVFWSKGRAMENSGTIAVSSRKSSLIQPGQFPPHLALDVEHPCLIQTANGSSQKLHEKVLVLMTLLQGLLEHTTNGDVVMHIVAEKFASDWGSTMTPLMKL